MMPIWRRLSIQAKLFFAYFMVAILPVTLLGVSAYYIAKESAQQEAMAVILQSHGKLASVIDGNCIRIESVSESLGANLDMTQFVAGDFSSAYDQYSAANRMTRGVQNTLTGLGGSSALTAISYSEAAYEIVSQDFDNRYNINSAAQGVLSPSGTRRISIYRLSRFEDQKWVSSFMTAKAKSQWLQTPQDTQFGNISYIRKLYQTGSGREVGIMKITVRLDDILGSNDTSPQEGEYCFFLLDSEKKPVIEPGVPGSFEDFSRQYGGAIAGLKPDVPVIYKNTLLVISPLRMGGGILGIYEMKSLREKTARIAGQVAIYAVIGIAAVALVSYLLAKYFASRIGRVTNDMELFRQGMHSTRTKAEGQDEISRLAAGFNDMADRIETLINDVYRAELTMNQEHLSMLQSQINPHFLYNSLSAIIRLAERDNLALIKEMTSALVRFYRLSLSRGQALIPLSNEIEHVTAYVAVFKIRRGNDFTVEYKLEEKALSQMVPKVILQPFVENSIQHGITPDRCVIRIIISASVTDGVLTCQICDDGAGMKDEAVAKVFDDSASQESGYGIKNVNDRIKAHFGKEWGVKIVSAQGKGTLVTLTMPAE